jgi:hypothetical protein
MAIKKLKHNFTTPEQSKRLLELGLPVDSADCLCSCKCNDYVYVLYKKPFSEIQSQIKDVIPCWSVGRLIEIWLHCNKFSINSTSEPITIGLIDFSNNFIDDFIHLIKKAVSSKHIDFSKLEE